MALIPATFDEGMKSQAAANSPSVDVELLQVLKI
jgi:hypothetical protein